MDDRFMQMALDLASMARGRTSPNPMVGAVVVKRGNVIGRGYHHHAGSPHAEVHALNEAGADARGATLYVTLEPCCHHGRTGPCTELIIKAGISRVVAATADPNPIVAGKGLKILREAGLEVTTGIMEKDARILNEVFNKYITTGRPFVVVKAAVSLDGKIATRTGKSKWITGSEARAYGHQMRDWYDSIMVGIGTVLADNPSLTTRLPGGGGRDPVRIILDSQARTPLNAGVLNQRSEALTIIASTARAHPARVKALKSAGIEVLTVNDGPRVDLIKLMELLGAKEITSVLVEGGAGVHGSAIAAGIVDKAAWFIAPKIIGGQDAPGPVGGEGAGDLTEAAVLERLTVSRLGSDLRIEGYFTRGGG